MNKLLLNKLIKCPMCRGDLISSKKSNECKQCNIVFNNNDNNQLNFIEKKIYDSENDYDDILSIQKFWDTGWEKRNKNEHHFLNLNSKDLNLYIKEKMIENNKRAVKNLFGKEIDLDTLNGKVGVNIGSGTGIEASYFMSIGKANIIAIDLTKEAARTTQLTMNKLGSGIAIQADARYLPIKNASIDFVYSSGVLHHSKNIEQSINEIYRILKPNGIAYIGLYSNTSIHFQLIRLRALLNGSFSSTEINDKLSSNTEKSWANAESVNPHTRIYGKSDCKKLFEKFSNKSFRRDGFSLPDRGVYKLIKFVERMKIFSFFGNGIYIKAQK